VEGNARAHDMVGRGVEGESGARGQLQVEVIVYSQGQGVGANVYD